MNENNNNVPSNVNSTEWEKFRERYKEQYTQQHQHGNGVCPYCGYCPHCSRGGWQPRPWYPYYPLPSYPQVISQITWPTKHWSMT